MIEYDTHVALFSGDQKQAQFFIDRGYRWREVVASTMSVTPSLLLTRSTLSQSELFEQHRYAVEYLRAMGLNALIESEADLFDKSISLSQIHDEFCPFKLETVARDRNSELHKMDIHVDIPVNRSTRDLIEYLHEGGFSSLTLLKDDVLRTIITAQVDDGALINTILDLISRAFRRFVLPSEENSEQNTTQVCELSVKSERLLKFDLVGEGSGIPLPKTIGLLRCVTVSN